MFQPNDKIKLSNLPIHSPIKTLIKRVPESDHHAMGECWEVEDSKGITLEWDANFLLMIRDKITT